MDEIIEYTILRSEMVERLSKLINEHIEDGWQPYGYMFIVEKRLIQPMVKYEGEPTYIANLGPK